MMSSPGICKAKLRKKRESGYSATHSWVLASSSSADHPGYSSIFFCEFAASFITQFPWNSCSTHNQEIMPLIISGISIHRWRSVLRVLPLHISLMPWLAVCGLPKSENLWGLLAEEGVPWKVKSEWSYAVTVGNCIFRPDFGVSKEYQPLT